MFPEKVVSIPLDDLAWKPDSGILGAIAVLREPSVGDSDFHDQVDSLMFRLEDELDELEEDLDIENAGGILTVNFPNGSTIVLSRQIANHEIWVAARSGGFHLAAKDGDWYCQTTDETLPVLISRVFSEQLGREVKLL